MSSDDSKERDRRQRQVEERGVWIKDTTAPKMSERPDGPPDSDKGSGRDRPPDRPSNGQREER